jgi:protein gp37
MIETKIQWAHSTWNPWRGCSNAVLPDGTTHPGCLNCYAERGAKRNPSVLGIWGPNEARVMAARATFRAPLRWNAAAKAAGERRRVFVDSYSDFFEEHDGPVTDSKGFQLYVCTEERYASGEKFDVARRTLTLDDLRSEAFKIIGQCDWLDFLILTKRPQNIRRMMPQVVHQVTRGGELEGELTRSFWPNVWLLTSVSNQQTANVMIPELLKARDLVPVLGVSAEPLLEAVDLTPWMPRWFFECDRCGCIGESVDEPFDPCGSEDMDDGCCRGHLTKTRGDGLDLVIIGGESGPKARPFDLAWGRSLIEQCRAAGVAPFFKQAGSNARTTLREIREVPNWRSVCHQVAGPGNADVVEVRLKDPKGGDLSELPEWLRVREFPKATVKQ